VWEEWSQTQADLPISMANAQPRTTSDGPYLVAEIERIVYFSPVANEQRGIGVGVAQVFDGALTSVLVRS
jgi:hypothetical protein